MTRQLESIVEERIAAWLARRSAADARLTSPSTTIAIARDRGAGGRAVATRVAQQLGFDVFDQEIVEAIASAAHTRRAVVESLDERTRGGVEEIARLLVNSERFTYSAYLEHLSHVVLAIAHHGHAVILGRGAHWLVPRGMRLAVRLVANRDHRLARTMELEGCRLDEAVALLDETDAQRAAFARKHFGADVRDPEQYHMILSSDALGIETSAEVIVEAYRRWHAAHSPD
ncbi:MAG: cytidylate kinase-like family protein [Deltaproteobacteria bacterium]|nr:cytidylate kinase-like family protein [Deltaproteobacteria bacterium]